MDKNILPDEYDINTLFMVSDREILEMPVSSEVLEEAEASRERCLMKS